ncbi:MAG: phospholipid carrier-dependent glycosyltransferase [Gemmiger sp.]|uniref:phospholipid carrier-dependent glycosyltransferase n=1 Tax=Gemmiger sp. TaxID=2049027 RepID=UPI002E77FA8C|nr:phospholipid carrier-dependent glycosyltransferase [Gemmiger sp.]MEE0801185.1 phospholipid carrier-dependent glycosyltransferase [Gemmiger sp.]
MSTIRQTQKERRTLWTILAAALAVRLLLALMTDGYSYDMNCFVAWGDKLASQGPAAFYSEGYFADYPPGYILVLGLIGGIRSALQISFESPWTYFLLAIVPAICDCAAVALLWKIATRSMGTGRERTALALFAAFCPLTLFDTGVWKQIDGAFALPLLFCFWLLEQRRYLPAAALYGLALAIKPQALLAGPVLAICFLVGIAEAVRDGQSLGRAVGRIFGGAGLALAVPLLAGLPFYGPVSLIPSLIEKYIGTTSGYPYATINAFNWFAALGGNWQPLESGPVSFLSWQTLGVFHIAVITVLLVVLAVVSWRAGRFSPLLLAAFYTVGIFTFAHCMHERYLVLGVLLVLLAAARWNDIRLYGAGFGLSLTGFANLAAVYTLVGTEDEWLSSDTSREFASIMGFAETVAFLLLAFTVWTICFQGAVSRYAPEPAPADRKRRPAPRTSLAAPASMPTWTSRERRALLVLTALTAVISFAYLGSTKAPQTPLDATDTTRTVTFTPQAETAELWIYPGISTGGSLTISTADGSVLYEKELNYGTPFSWSAVSLTAPAGQPLTATVSNAQVFELALRDAAGELVPVTGGDQLFDEQTEVPETISQLNSMYFDEIYHGRTGYEMLHRLTVYETTHPPLGKDFIMLGIAIFGMTGFGWRFSGTLFGVLLVPLAWCFARRLTRKPWAGAVAGVLLALDFMRFSQSRIATIDIYATFFILLSADCMLWYCQSVLQKGVHGSVIPMALGGIAFGLGCASKWTGIYAGAGLAVLYLGVLYARWQQHKPDFWKEFRLAALGGVVFYIAVPLMIYLASYLPYWWRDPSFGLEDWWNCQTYMYWYHSTLNATHPFESRWYTWLLDLRPVWYYLNGYLPSGTKASIAGMYSPVLCLAGLVSILLVFWRQISARGSRAGAGLLILYATQLLPWMLVSRCTFLYHYFPSSMFALAAIVFVLSRMEKEQRAKQIAAGLCVAALICFVWFYPALSGLPIPEAWAESTQILPSYGFY